MRGVKSLQQFISMISELLRALKPKTTFPLCKQNAKLALRRVWSCIKTGYSNEKFCRAMSCS